MPLQYFTKKDIMKKIIMSLIIIATIVAGYCSYQQFNNQQTTQSHEQLDDVKIQASSDGGSCSDNSDCDSGDCNTSTGICKGNCGMLFTTCTSSEDCCHGYYCDITTSTCGSSIGTGNLETEKDDDLAVHENNLGLNRHGPEQDSFAINKIHPAKRALKYGEDFAEDAALTM